MDLFIVSFIKNDKIQNIINNFIIGDTQENKDIEKGIAEEVKANIPTPEESEVAKTPLQNESKTEEVAVEEKTAAADVAEENATAEKIEEAAAADVAEIEMIAAEETEAKDSQFVKERPAPLIIGVDKKAAVKKANTIYNYSFQSRLHLKN